MRNSKLFRRGALVVLAAMSVSGCDAFTSEPTYGGLSVEGFNYTPYNLTDFTVRDKHGNRASGGGDLPPSAGEGRLSCCYKLKGTDFTVEWEVYDADEAIRALDAHEEIKTVHKSTQIHVSPTSLSGGPGTRIIGLHFYPDDHVEVEFRSDLSGTRIDYTEVHHWFQTTYGKAANPDNLDWAAAYRRTARVAAQGWMKYRLTDSADLEQYVYFTLLVNPQFDEHPAVREILNQTKNKPGAFGAALQSLSPSVMQQLKNDGFNHVSRESKNG